MMMVTHSNTYLTPRLLWWPTATFLYLLLFATNNNLCCTAQSTIGCPSTSETYSSTNLETVDPRESNNNEISGIAFSSRDVAPSGEPVLYGINDGGNGERLIVWDSGTGQRIRTFYLPHVENVDWEDLTIGPCGLMTSNSGSVSSGNDYSCLYIADTGDNKARGTSGNQSNRNNRTYQMIKIVEPVWSEYDDYATLPASSIAILNFDYRDPSSPTLSADSESVFLDHKGWGQGGAAGDIYVMTKWGSGSRTRLFQIPVAAWYYAAEAGTTASAGTVYSPVAVGSYGNANTVLTEDIWFRAEMTTDGTIIALGGKEQTRLFLRCPGQSVADAMAPASEQQQQLVCHSWPNPTLERQVESFAWSPDSRRALQITEGANSVMSWTDILYTPPLQAVSRSNYQTCPDLVFVNNGNGGDDSECQDATTGQVFALSRCEEAAPTMPPTTSPSRSPTMEPSFIPTLAPTSSAPTKGPTLQPSMVPTEAPTMLPTEAPTMVPTKVPTEAPTMAPTKVPTMVPTGGPTKATSRSPTLAPTSLAPSDIPTGKPTTVSSLSPTQTPTQPAPVLAVVESALEEPVVLTNDVVYSTEAPAPAQAKQTTTNPTFFVNIINGDEAPAPAPAPVEAKPTSFSTIDGDNMYAAALAIAASATTASQNVSLTPLPMAVVGNTTSSARFVSNATTSTSAPTNAPSKPTKAPKGSMNRQQNQNLRHNRDYR